MGKDCCIIQQGLPGFPGIPGANGATGATGPQGVPGTSPTVGSILGPVTVSTTTVSTVTFSSTQNIFPGQIIQFSDTNGIIAYYEVLSVSGNNATISFLNGGNGFTGSLGTVTPVYTGGYIPPTSTMAVQVLGGLQSISISGSSFTAQLAVNPKYTTILKPGLKIAIMVQLNTPMSRRMGLARPKIGFETATITTISSGSSGNTNISGTTSSTSSASPINGSPVLTSPQNASVPVYNNTIFGTITGISSNTVTIDSSLATVVLANGTTIFDLTSEATTTVVSVSGSSTFVVASTSGFSIGDVLLVQNSEVVIGYCPVEVDNIVLSQAFSFTVVTAFSNPVSVKFNDSLNNFVTGSFYTSSSTTGYLQTTSSPFSGSLPQYTVFFQSQTSSNEYSGVIGPINGTVSGAITYPVNIINVPTVGQQALAIANGSDIVNSTINTVNVTDLICTVQQSNNFTTDSYSLGAPIYNGNLTFLGQQVVGTATLTGATNTVLNFTSTLSTMPNLTVNGNYLLIDPSGGVHPIFITQNNNNVYNFNYLTTLNTSTTYQVVLASPVFYGWTTQLVNPSGTTFTVNYSSVSTTPISSIVSQVSIGYYTYQIISDNGSTLTVSAQNGASSTIPTYSPIVASGETRIYAGYLGTVTVINPGYFQTTSPLNLIPGSGDFVFTLSGSPSIVNEVIVSGTNVDIYPGDTPDDPFGTITPLWIGPVPTTPSGYSTSASTPVGILVNPGFIVSGNGSYQCIDSTLTTQTFNATLSGTFLSFNASNFSILAFSPIFPA